MVREAVEAGVDAVVLAGDVVERENDFFEAYRELHRGVGRLAEAGIRVLGVAGNHDVEVLPRLTREIPAFKLLGAGGKWQAEEIKAAGEVVTIWGWSCPRAGVPESPLDGQRFEPGPGLNIGGLDAGEPGDRGPWLVVVESGRIQAAAHWVLAPLRWERLELVIGEIAWPEEARDSRWSGLRVEPPDETTAIETLRCSGLRLLHSMLSQQESSE